MIELVGKLLGKCLVSEICISSPEIAKLSTMSAHKFDVGDRTVVSLVSRLLVQCSTLSVLVSKSYKKVMVENLKAKSMFSIVHY